MKTKHKIIVVLTFVAVLIISFLFFSKSYYPAFPIDGISKSEAIYLLNNEYQQLIKLKDEDQYSWYGFKGNQLDGSKELIKTLKDRGWIFKEQLGSGYFFQDSSNSSKIVVSQMWTRNYVIYKVQN
jgi:hypothetical protein